MSAKMNALFSCGMNKLRSSLVELTCARACYMCVCALVCVTDHTSAASYICVCTTDPNKT